jgi:hypothetical protein
MGKADSGVRQKRRRTSEWVLITLFALAIAALAIVALTGLGDSNDPGISGESDIRAALDPLPYAYTLRQVEVPDTEAAFTGHARDANGDVADFAVSACGNTPRPDCPTPTVGHRRGSESGAGNANYWVKVEGGARSRRLEMWATIDSALCDAAALHEFECNG